MGFEKWNFEWDCEFGEKNFKHFENGIPTIAK